MGLLVALVTREPSDAGSDSVDKKGARGEEEIGARQAARGWSSVKGSRVLVVLALHFRLVLVSMLCKCDDDRHRAKMSPHLG